jgi:aminoglycoside 2'-N-acetyltransferase I
MATIEVFTTGELSVGRVAEIRRLLDRAFVGGFTDEDWEHALGGHHVLVIVGGDVVAHAAVVSRDIEVAGRHLHAGYVEAVATDPAGQRGGLGTQAIAEATRVVMAGYEFGALSTGVHLLYERLGWERWEGPTYVRRGAQPERTVDDDDAVMVLRFGPSDAIDLTAPISCEGRSGDDW